MILNSTPPAPSSLLSGQEQATNTKSTNPAKETMPMLDIILNHDLVVCAQSGDATQIQNYFTGFIELIKGLCTSDASYNEKYATFVAIEHILTMFSHDHEDMCKTCQKKIMSAVEYVRYVRIEVLEKVARKDVPNAPPQLVKTHLRWNGSRVAFCEKLYGEYVICYTGTHDKKFAPLRCLINAYNDL